MIQCDHFLYAYFPSVGHKLIKSSGIDKILPDERLEYLSHIGGNSKTPQIVINYLPEEHLFSFSYIRPQKDEFGRDSTWNHTIILTPQDCFDLKLFRFMEKHFIHTLAELPTTLNPLTIKVE